MKLILLNKDASAHRTVTISSWTLAFLSVCLLGLPIGLGGFLAYQTAQLNDENDIMTAEAKEAWKENIAAQQAEVESLKQQSQEKISALTVRMAELQGRLMRIDALGERLTTVAKLDKGEFDFHVDPAVGGPEAQGESYQAPAFIHAIDSLASQIDDREQQLETLDALLVKRKIEADIFLAGRPVRKGWLSSRYGNRTDPFNGKVAWHNGVDFAGKHGADVVAVAAGVITWASNRAGYGSLVEVNHGAGFSTRYAHNSDVKVAVGDVVKKGQTIAAMGSSGRSTGPHVHFEVYKNGRSVDPASYVRRNRR